MKALVSKYLPFFLAYLFWVVLIGVGLTVALYCDAIDPRYTSIFPPEKRLEAHTAAVDRDLLYFLLIVISKIWFYPLVFTVITAVVVESLPERRADES